MIFNLLKGYIYGVFSISPGLSGGVLANFFGDYKKCVDILMKKKLSKYNVLYLATLFIGFLFGICTFARIISYFYSTFTSAFRIIIFLINLFILLNLLFKKGNNIVKLLYSFLIAFLFILIFLLVKNCLLSLNIIILYVLSGFIYSVSKIIPGISSTSLLLSVNFYDNIMNFFSHPFYTLRDNLFLWTLFWLSFTLFSLLTLKILYYLIKKNYFDDVISIILIINLLVLFI